LRSEREEPEISLAKIAKIAKEEARNVLISESRASNLLTLTLAVLAILARAIS
jgi:hypothetical protein